MHRCREPLAPSRRAVPLRNTTAIESVGVSASRIPWLFRGRQGPGKLRRFPPGHRGASAGSRWGASSPCARTLAGVVSALPRTPATAKTYPLLYYNCAFSSCGAPSLRFFESWPKRYPKKWCKKDTLTNLYVEFCIIVYFESQKGLEASSHRIMFRLPSVLGLSANNRSVRRIRASSSGSLARIFRNFGIDVDEGNAKVLDGPLSPSGEAL